jgi:diguanylate cyclase (GGDEF)-like protein
VARLRSLSTKVVVLLLVAAFLPLLSYYLVTNQVVTGVLLRIEDNEVRSANSRAKAVLLEQASALLKYARDYAEWDEMYAAISADNPRWMEQNVTRWLPQNYGVDAVAVIGLDGRMAASYSVPAPLDVSPLSDEQVASALRGERTFGVQRHSDRIYLTACAPILKDGGMGSPNGCLLIGRLLDERWLAGIEDIVGRPIAISCGDVFIASPAYSEMFPAGPPDYPGAAGELSVARTPTDLLVARAGFQDASRRETIYIHTSTTRTAYNSTISYVRRTALQTAWGTVLVTAVLAYVLQAAALRPFKQLEEGISRIRRKKAFEKLSEDGPAEVSSFARAFNEMAASLEEHIAKSAALTAMCYTDAVTGAHNYRYFHEQLATELKEARQHLRPLVLGLLDINYFKFYNDAMGHTHGDEALRSVVMIASKVIGERGTISRYGGDDFGFILPNTDANTGRQILHRIAEEIENYPFPGRELLPGGKLTVAVGMAVFPDDATNKEDLYRSASLDKNLAKTTGTGRALRYFNAFASIVRPGGDPMGLVGSAQVLLAIVDSVDHYTYWHTQRVVRYTEWISSRMGVDLDTLETLRIAAFLHDVGKIEVSRDILTKRGALDTNEWDVMKMHPVWGADMVRPVERLRSAAPMIESHHERFDGNGYPKGLRGDSIPFGARLISVADAFDAMTTDRPYRKAVPPEGALAELERCAGTQFDPAVVRAFVSSVDDPAVRKRLFEKPREGSSRFSL